MGKKTQYVGGVVRFEPNPPQTHPVIGGGQRQVFYISLLTEAKDKAEQEAGKSTASTGTASV